MNTTNEKLADALRACLPHVIIADCAEYDDARAMLAEYDAQPATPTGAIRAEGQELVGHDWDNGPQAWDVIRDDGEQWYAFADPEFSARIVACVNACAGIEEPASLVAAFKRLSDYVGGHDCKPGHPCRVASDTLGYATETGAENRAIADNPGATVITTESPLHYSNARWRTKQGRCTRYALACGDIEERRNGAFNVRLRMPSPSAGVILVTAQGDDWRVLYSGKSLVRARAAMVEYMRSAPC